MPATPPSSPPARSSSARWRAFVIALLVAAITVMDLSKINVTLPSIEAALGASSTSLQVLVAGYVLTFGLVLVPSGRIGDQRSRRGMFLIGLLLFTLMSLLCAIAPTIELLLVARLLQGVAAGIQMPQVLGLIQQLFQTPQERGTAFGLFGAVVGVSIAVGPTVSGLLIAAGGPVDGWRWTFWMNVPICVVVWVLAYRMLPMRRSVTITPLALDPIGILLLGCATLALMWPFLFTTGSADDNPHRWWLLGAAALITAAFIVWERRYEASGKTPLVPLGLFRRAAYRHGLLVMLAYFAATPSMFLLTNLFLQTGADYAAVYAGLVTIGYALSSAVFSWLSGAWVVRFGRGMVNLGLVVVLLSVGGLVIAALTMPTQILGWVMSAVLLVGGLGAGLVMSPNQTLALMDVDAAQGGLAGSVGQLGQRIGTAIGTAFALSLFYATVRARDGAAHATVYAEAYAYGMLAVAALYLLALLVGMWDQFYLARSRGR